MTEEDFRQLQARVGVDWSGALAECSEDERAAVRRWVRPVVTLTTSRAPDSTLELGCTKLGGCPDLPPEVPWPMSDRGPLGFLGQIAFEDLAGTAAAEHYPVPKSGLLLFFALDDAEEGVQPGVVDRNEAGEYAEIEGLTALMYVSERTGVVRRPLPEGVVRPNPPCRVVLGEGLDVPHPGDVDDPVLQDFDGVWDLRNGMAGEHYLFGWSVHGRTDNTSPGPHWVSLATFGSDDLLGWSWCDGENLDWYVHGEALANHSFDRWYGYAA